MANKVLPFPSTGTWSLSETLELSSIALTMAQALYAASLVQAHVPAANRPPWRAVPVRTQMIFRAQAEQAIVHMGFAVL